MKINDVPHLECNRSEWIDGYLKDLSDLGLDESGEIASSYGRERKEARNHTHQRARCAPREKPNKALENAKEFLRSQHKVKKNGPRVHFAEVEEDFAELFEEEGELNTEIPRNGIFHNVLEAIGNSASAVYAMCVRWSTPIDQELVNHELTTPDEGEAVSSADMHEIWIPTVMEPQYRTSVSKIVLSFGWSILCYNIMFPALAKSANPLFAQALRALTYPVKRLIGYSIPLIILGAPSTDSFCERVGMMRERGLVGIAYDIRTATARLVLQLGSLETTYGFLSDQSRNTYLLLGSIALLRAADRSSTATKIRCAALSTLIALVTSCRAIDCVETHEEQDVIPEVGNRAHWKTWSGSSGSKYAYKGNVSMSMHNKLFDEFASSDATISGTMNRMWHSAIILKPTHRVDGRMLTGREINDTIVYTLQVMKGLQVGSKALTGVKPRPLTTPFG